MKVKLEFDMETIRVALSSKEGTVLSICSISNSESSTAKWNWY
jgi:hypothetical protein